MTEEERNRILERSKVFFRDNIARNHLETTAGLTLSSFKINPFLHEYIAQFAFGSCTPENLAKALVYPRVMGTSISTTFGTQMQKFCDEVLDGFATAVTGMDIEFVDAEDGRRKYCQVKSGPNTINKDDVVTIENHFRDARNLARTNHLPMDVTDCVVGVLYGTEDDLSTHYKKINEDYPVYVGAEFWYRLTGDRHFYHALIDAFADSVQDLDGSEILQGVINDIAHEIEARENDN